MTAPPEPILISDSDEDELPAVTRTSALLPTTMHLGQTLADAIPIPDDDAVPEVATRGLSSQLPHNALNAAQVHHKAPGANGTFQAARPAALERDMPPRSSALNSSSPPIASAQLPPNTIPGSFFKPLAQSMAADIPLPQFHQLPAEKPKMRLARRPHPASSDGSPKSPDRKRMRLGDEIVSKGSSSSNPKHEIALRQLGRVATPSSSHSKMQHMGGTSHDRNARSTAAGAHSRIEMVVPRGPRAIEGHNSPISKSNDHAALAENTLFPLATHIGERKLHDISSDVASRMVGLATIAHDADELLYGILRAATSLSDLADQILLSFHPSADKVIAEDIKANFDRSFRQLQQDSSNADISKDHKCAWIAAVVCHALVSAGKSSLPDPEPMPETDMAVSQSGKTVMNADNPAVASIEYDDEDVDMTADEAPRQKTTNFIKKGVHYMAADVLRLKGRDVAQPRPYIARNSLKDIHTGTRSSAPTERLKARSTRLVSVPFQADELAALRDVLYQWYNESDRTEQDLDRAERGTLNRDFLALVAGYVRANILYDPKRRSKDYSELLRDLPPITKFLESARNPPLQSKTIALVKKPISRVAQDGGTSVDKVRTLLRGRDLAPNIDRATQQIQSLVLRQLDDSFTRDIEFSGGPGDIASFTWLSEDNFICGAITNCDLYNQDYNKPGNIVIGSARTKIASAIPGHRIPRPPKPQKTETAVVDSQDPWLYSSVPMTAFDAVRCLCFTASYDKTVKIWRASNDRLTMHLLGTWAHDGHVNLIVTSPCHDKVATASDVKYNGIRVYDLKNGDLGSLNPRLYSGSRAQECADKNLPWAYFPSTMQWGISKDCSHYLAVGYSPRSLEVHSDVPYEKRNTGQLCVWNTRTRNEVGILGPKTQNVFEVAWHPSQAVFVAATSASGLYDEGVKTQLRLFVYRDVSDSFAALKTFSCWASDINEITLKPSSYKEFYLTASCTDRKTYVWDSIQGEYPVHTLCHDGPIDQIDERLDAEEVDAGVKFAAWGRTADRFYTGSSDGVLKAWNVRAPPGEEFLGDILFASGGISCGLFSPDRTRLAVGDTSGKIHLMKIWDEEFDDKPVYTRTAIRPFYEPGRPISGGIAKAKEFLSRDQIRIHPDKYVGAIQGPNYASIGLYRLDKHIGGDLQSVPDDVARGQLERRSKDKLVIPRLPGAFDVEEKENHATCVFEELCKYGMKIAEARLIANTCGALGISIEECVSLFRDTIDMRSPPPDTYEAEAEAANPFSREDRDGSLRTKTDQRSHSLTEHETAEFATLKTLISNESLVYEAFEKLLNGLRD